MKKDRIKVLETLIKHHQEKYYNEEPEISDAEFDLLWDELKQLDPQNKLFQVVGQDSTNGYPKRKHILFMGSQEKVSTPAEFYKWAEKNNFEELLVEFKYDGISIELQYENGEFTNGITRGDGKIGDDISDNVRKMQGFIQSIDHDFTGGIRAEIVMMHDVFEKKYPDASNCRNMASGISKRKDGHGYEDLTIIPYDAMHTKDRHFFRSEENKIIWITNQNFLPIRFKHCFALGEVVSYWEEVTETLRHNINFDIDGLVVKALDIERMDGSRSTPKKQIAFKFPLEFGTSKLLEVEWSQKGHNYTPVAIIEKIELAGTNVERASLANPNLINELGLKIGSKVLVSKRGEIIPKIEKVLDNPSDTTDITVPTTCSECGSELANEGTRLYCPNQNCISRDYHRLQKWIKKLGIQFFGKVLLKKLFNSGKILKIVDLYRLTMSDLTELDGVAELGAARSLNNLVSVSEVSLAKFIGAFDIEGVGEKLVDLVVQSGYDTLDKIKATTAEQIAAIQGLGDITGSIIIEGINRLYDDMQDVLSSGKIRIKVEEATTETGGKSLEGLSFCFTGRLNTMKRAEAEALVREKGGTTKSGVSKGLSYLVTNDTTPTAKYTKAKEQNTKIITEIEFLELIGYK